MACGCAVISSDNLGSLELIEHDFNGLIVPVGDINGYLKSIEYLVGNEKERRRLVEKGLKTVKKFSWDTAVDKMEQFLKTLV